MNHLPLGWGRQALHTFLTRLFCPLPSHVALEKPRIAPLVSLRHLPSPRPHARSCSSRPRLWHARSGINKSKIPTRPPCPVCVSQRNVCWSHGCDGPSGNSRSRGRLVYCVMSMGSRSIKIEIESAYGDTVEGETRTLYLCW